MHDFVCIDETFDPNFTIEYKLSIQVSLDGFSFCILDNIRKKYLVFKHYPFRLSNPKFLSRKIKELLKKEEILSNKYKTIKILIDSPYFTALPEGEGIEQKPEIYLSQNYKLPKNAEFKIFHSDFFNCSVVYSYSNQLKTLFDEKFENYNIVHQIEPIIQRITSNKVKDDISCILNVGTQYYTAFIYENKKLLFINTFNYKNEQDFLYFLFTSFKTLGVNPEEIKMQIIGKIKEKSSIHNQLLSHIKHLEFLKFNTSFQYSYTFEKLPQHQFVNVINPEG